MSFFDNVTDEYIEQFEDFFFTNTETVKFTVKEVVELQSSLKLITDIKSGKHKGKQKDFFINNISNPYSRKSTISFMRAAWTPEQRKKGNCSPESLVGTTFSCVASDKIESKKNEGEYNQYFGTFSKVKSTINVDPAE